MYQGQPNASAGIGVYFHDSDGRKFSGHLIGGRQDCLRAEAEAVRQALKMLSQDRRIPLNEPVVIWTDSDYVIRNVCNVQDGQRPDGDDDIFHDIVRMVAASSHPVTFRKVAAHSGNALHDIADSLAKDGAKLR
ncbi:hypothetical protein H4R21_002270 [Coemansia helicoidea]|uniref:Uncharacterized protein n=1 Tax=Coemansia helicoidea TaxID=1286919 RepID=A0ACC1L958_9FUNG|nr:hypothetical protein H4R21_002270 [Coemansia helicoidea]